MPRDESKANMLMDELISTSRPMGFDISRGQMIRLPDSRGSHGIVFAASIKDAIRSLNPQMIVCVMPNTNKDVYDAIKRACCVEFGIPSQCVTSNLLNSNNIGKTKSAITKIAIQMNCKLGGEIWGVNIPVDSFLIFLKQVVSLNNLLKYLKRR